MMQPPQAPICDLRRPVDYGRRRQRAVSLAFLLTAILLCVAPAYAQTAGNTGLDGRVTDQTDAALVDVVVHIRNVENGSERSVTTGPDGAWEARFLAPGRYLLTFDREGFRSLQRDGVTVTTSEMGTVNVALELGDTKEWCK